MFPARLTAYSRPLLHVPVVESPHRTGQSVRPASPANLAAARLQIRTCYQAQRKSLGTHPQRALASQNFLIAGGSDEGFGVALACAAINVLNQHGSVTLLTRETHTRTAGYQIATALRECAAHRKVRFDWINLMRAASVKNREIISLAHRLRRKTSREFLYFDAWPAAPVPVVTHATNLYVIDINDKGELQQWKMRAVNDSEVDLAEISRHDFGLNLPTMLRERGITVGQEHYFDDRGTGDRASYDPMDAAFGRQGALNGTLGLGRRAVWESLQKLHGDGRTGIHLHLLPTSIFSDSRLIPGGRIRARLYRRLALEGWYAVPSAPEQALQVLERVAQIHKDPKNQGPYIRHNCSEEHVDDEVFDRYARVTARNFRNLLGLS